jgi:hypothetical protein
MQDLLQALMVGSSLATPLAALAAVLSAICAFLSFRLARSIQNELKSDEQIVAGSPHHPDLRTPDHARCVLQFPLFNKSKRKAFVSAVKAFDQFGEPFPIAWADGIDSVGNPKDSGKLVPLVDLATLYVRNSAGREISFARLEISHSFSDMPLIVLFDTYGDLMSAARD